MSSVPSLRAIVLAVIVAAGGACAGDAGPAGTGGWAGQGGAGGGGGSPAPYPLPSLDAACGTNGITGAKVLAAVMPEYRTKLGLPGQPVIDLSIRTTYKGGGVVCHPAVKAPRGSGAPDRPEHVRVDASMDFATADSAFAEAFTTEIDGGWGVTTFDHHIPIDELSGSHARLLGPEFTDVVVGISGRFESPMTSGSVMEGGNRGGVGGTQPVGNWPSGK